MIKLVTLKDEDLYEQESKKNKYNLGKRFNREGNNSKFNGYKW